MRAKEKDTYAAFRAKLMGRFCAAIAASAAAVLGLYLFLWRQRMGDWVLWFLERVLRMDHRSAFYFYSDHFRNNREAFFFAALLLVFSLLLWRIFRWVTRYFAEINQGIEDLLEESGQVIRLSPEMLPFQRKLNTVKGALEARRAEAATAERRKNELVMYLAHDIRTPLTSVIGYLNLLTEEPDVSPEQRAKRLRIALEKACRLETMINELFEITRYNSQQIALSKESIDLCYMLVQLSDELSPLFEARGNRVTLRVDEALMVEVDAEKMARVFGNILKNAAAYSDPCSEIVVSAERLGREVVVRFQNQGEDIPAEALALLFDKFYRVDKARSSDKGGTGLGLAIAKEIVALHGGRISAASGGHTVAFTVRLPAEAP